VDVEAAHLSLRHADRRWELGGARRELRPLLTRDKCMAA